VQGPTIAPVYNVSDHPSSNGNADLHFYATTICVRKKQLYAAVKALRQVRVQHVCWTMTAHWVTSFVLSKLGIQCRD
jgi:hypothetical protein